MDLIKELSPESTDGYESFDRLLLKNNIFRNGYSLPALIDQSAELIRFLKLE